MNVIGVDFGKPGSDRTTLSSARPFYPRVGDPVHMTGTTNKYRTRVAAVLSDSLCELKTYVRASRGYARHVRRQKQLRRMQRHGR